MRATLMYKAGDVRVVDVPDPTISEPSEALVRVTYACVCGSDLHPYHDLEDTPEGRRMGHEAIGVVEEVGAEVTTLKPGDTVIVPFAWSDGTAIVVPVGTDAVAHAVAADAVRRLPHRLPLGRTFGATHVVAERGDEGVAKVLQITNGDGSHVVLEAVGHLPAYEQAYGIVRPGGVISRVGVPQYEEAPVGFASLFGKNATLTGGPATVRAYLEAAIPQVLDGTIDPGQVFDRELPPGERPSR